jgi:hypothetical protein
MSTRKLLTALASVTVAAVCGCPAPNAAADPPALTRQPCELLTPELATRYLGDDAERQLTYAGTTPPVPVEDTACYYTGTAREMYLSITQTPTDPTAPINHFHVIRPQNRVPGVPYDAYWFAAGESLVVVKDALVIDIKVADIGGGYLTDQDRPVDIEVANLIVPRIG